jgi:SAM-dependent methyltransferase
MIPKTLHYCFGMAADFGGKPWSLVHYVCVKSAVERLKPSKVCFWCEYVPEGPWWRLTEPMVDVFQIKAPRKVFGRPLLHPAHRADVVRLDKLLEHGGIYLDADVFVHRNFDDLLPHRVVMGEQDDRGLCNAVILAEPGASFIRRWKEEYRSFRSRGKDQYWDEHSVQVPMSLANHFPDEITRLSAAAFFWPSCSSVGLERIFSSIDPILPAGRYANHLWENLAWQQHLADLTLDRVRTIDSNFHFWARPLTSSLSNDCCDESAVSPAVKRIGKEPLKRIEKPVSPSQWPGLKQTLSPAWHKAGRTLSLLFPNSRFARVYRRRTFQNVYEWQLWGAEKFERYFSGVGSRGEPAKVYVEAMAPIIADASRSFGREVTVVDLGCGDFRVTRALLERLLNVRYIGCDIVPELIAENTRRYGSANTIFRCLDMVAEDLPLGDIYLVRQVLQQLQNRDIARLMAKLPLHENVYVTEGQPEIREGPVNPDKPIGAEVRFNWKTGRGRGVELDQPPFNLGLEEICRAWPHPELCREVIVTYRVRSKDGPSAQCSNVAPHSERVKQPEEPNVIGRL